jgi:hypothetical protein
MVRGKNLVVRLLLLQVNVHRLMDNQFHHLLRRDNMRKRVI